ncbi:unnamed protein product [Pieris macdunnoughi]|nr:unnamed protein product [Pieris macdunnoughi]
MVELGVKVAVVSEPYYVAQRSHWKGDTLGLVAVIVSPMGMAITLRERGPGYVMVDWGPCTVVGTYFSLTSRFGISKALLET